MLVIAAMIGGYIAMNIGANDVANNVGPAVGGRALSLAAALAIAAVFEAARLLRDVPTDRSIIFACWSAEEVGLWGTRHVRLADLGRPRMGFNVDGGAPADLVTAALGGELEVPTLDGRVKLKIPEETQTGKLFRLRSKGVQPVRGGPVGDLLCRVVVETPSKLSSEQKEILRDFEKTLHEGGSRHRPHETSWLDGVKNFFEGMKF